MTDTPKRVSDVARFWVHANNAHPMVAGTVLPVGCVEIVDVSQFDAERAANAKLRAQLPTGMEHCTIEFKECALGHGWLTATNWIDNGCPTCRFRSAATPASGGVVVAEGIVEKVNHTRWYVKTSGGTFHFTDIDLSRLDGQHVEVVARPIAREGTPTTKGEK